MSIKYPLLLALSILVLVLWAFADIFYRQQEAISRIDQRLDQQGQLWVAALETTSRALPREFK
jgi:type II secretory pathway component PulJ